MSIPNIPVPNIPIPDIPFPDIPDPKDLVNLDRPAEILNNLKDIIQKERDSIITTIDRQVDHLQNDYNRFKELLKKEAIKQTEPVVNAMNKILDAKKKLIAKKDALFDQYKKQEKAFIKTLTDLRSDIRDEIYHDLHIDDLKKLEDEVNKYRTEVSSAYKVFKDITGIKNKHLEYLNSLIDAKADEKLVKEWKDIVDKDTKAVTNAKKVWENAKSSVSKAIKNVKNLKNEISSVTKADVIRESKSALKKIGLDIDAIAVQVNEIKSDVAASRELMTRGFNKMYEDMLIGKGKPSKLWEKATQRTAHESEAEMKKMADELKELEKLAKIEDREAFLKLASKYSSPSRRILLQYRKEFNEFRSASSSLFGILLDYAKFALKTLSNAVKMISTFVAERIIGPAGMASLRILAGVIKTTALAIFKVMGALANVAMVVVAEYYVVQDGFTFNAFVDVVKTLIGVDLKGLEGVHHRLVSDYKEYTTVANVKDGVASDKFGEVRTGQSDSKELKAMLDFWGKAYVDELRARNPHYKEYKPMKSFKIQLRKPGRYIKRDDHPYDTDAEYQQCLRMENELDHFDKQDVRTFKGRVGHGSQVFRDFPRKKNWKKTGEVRNLAAFPYYEKTFKWPPPEGSLYQTRGYFTKNDIDPTIISEMEKWVKTGKHGPIYHLAKTRETQQAAIDANLKDLKNYLDPKFDSGTAMVELHEWMSMIKGALRTYYDDMLILAPDKFEYDKKEDDPAPKWHIAFDIPKPLTLGWYEQEVSILGRWLYGKTHLEFYNDIIYRNKVKITESIGPKSYVSYRSTKPGERKFYMDIKKRGFDQSRYLKKLSAGVIKKWSKIDINRVWKDYRTDIGANNPKGSQQRTIWTYIQKHRMIFLDELEFQAKFMMQQRKYKLIEEYKREISGTRDPLDIPAATRALVMGQLNQVAFMNKPEFTAEELLLKNFKSIKDNILLTSKHVNEPWAKKTTQIIFIKLGNTTLLKDIMVRVFTTENPFSVIMVFKNGKEDIAHQRVQTWESESVFLKYEGFRPGSKVLPGNIPNITTVDKLDVKNQDELIDSDAFMQVFKSPYKIWDEMQITILGIIEEIVKLGVKDMSITGYGKGAELAQIAALYVPRIVTYASNAENAPIISTKHPKCYLFASKPVGDRRFDITFSTLTSEVIHVWNDGDLMINIPPVILPSQSSFKDLYEREVESLKLAAQKYPYFAGELFLLSNGFKLFDKDGPLSYVNILDDPVSRNLFDTYTYESLDKDMEKIVMENVHFQAYRGGGIFLRLHDDGEAAYETNFLDPLNSVSSLIHLTDNEETVKHITHLHSLETILYNLMYELNHHTDDFIITPDKMAKWKDDGEINKPHPPRPPRLPSKIINDLLTGKARVIGYAHTKHHHRSGTIVPKSDVDEYIPLPVHYNMFDIRAERTRAKRRKTVHKNTNGEYHGYTY